MLLHHLAVSSAFVLGAVTQTHLFPLTVALLTEVNSAFLHLRTLMKLPYYPSANGEITGYDVRDTSGYRTVAMFNILTFVAFRVLVFLWLGLKLTVIKASVSAPVYVIFWAGLIIVALISFIHFRRLIVTDFFTPRKSGTNAKS